MTCGVGQSDNNYNQHHLLSVQAGLQNNLSPCHSLRKALDLTLRPGRLPQCLGNPIPGIQLALSMVDTVVMLCKVVVS